MTSPFTKNLPHLQFAWDSVSMSNFLFCPRSYQYAILEGWQAKGKSLPMSFGIAFHRAMEEYYKLIGKGVPHNDALVEVCRQASTVVLPTAVVYDDEGKEKRDPRDTFTLLRSIVWHLDQLRGSQTKTYLKKDGGPAIEMSFRIATPLEHQEGPFLLCGHIDRVIEYPDGTLFVNDYKTTAKTISSNFFRGFDLDWQITNYIFAAAVEIKRPVSGARIEGIQVAVGFSRSDYGVTYRTPSQIDEWLKSTYHSLVLAERYAEEGFWPMNLRNCYACQFKKVCAKAPEVREQYLADDFEKRPWNPLENR